jgi:hypothetical protein
MSPLTLTRAAPFMVALIVLSGCSSSGDAATFGSSGSGGLAQGGAGNPGGGASGSSGSNFGGSGGRRGSGGTGVGGAGGAGMGGIGGVGGTGAVAGTGGAGGAPIGGYVTSGAWHGYLWTAIGGTGSILPGDFADVTSPPFCASGTVATGSMNVALLGFNLNQGTAASSPIATVVPTLGGITVSVTNRTTAPLRLQIQGPNGATDANDRWCAPILSSGGFIPWSAFNTACWDGSGSAYNRQPLVSAMILVPGDNTGSVSFDFCLNSLAETNDPGASGGGGCSLTGSSGEGTGTITGTFDWAGVTRNTRNYVVQNNVWGGSSNQALSYNGVSFQVTQQSGTNPTTGQPISYPSVFIGANNLRNTSGSNLPKRVGSLTTVPTGWSWSRNSASGEYNATYDVWFSTGAGGDSGNPSGGYLMVWFYKPGQAQPIGKSQGTVGIAGRSWDVWSGGSQLGHPIISYVDTQGTNSLSFDLNDFIKDAVTRGVVQNGWYLTNVFAGFEIWSGGTTLRTDNFCTIVN